MCVCVCRDFPYRFSWCLSRGFSYVTIPHWNNLCMHFVLISLFDTPHPQKKLLTIPVTHTSKSANLTGGTHARVDESTPRWRTGAGGVAKLTTNRSDGGERGNKKRRSETRNKRFFFCYVLRKQNWNTIGFLYNSSLTNTRARMESIRSTAHARTTGARSFTRGISKGDDIIHPPAHT